MAIKHPGLAQALGARGHHILLADFLNEGVFGKQRQARESAHHHRRDGQHHMPEIIKDFGTKRQVTPTFRDNPAQRKPLKIATTRKQNQQQHGEQKRRHRLPNGDNSRCPDIERGAIAHGLADAERNRHEIDDERRPESERNRDGKLLRNQRHHWHIAEKTGAEIEPRILFQHDPEALGRGLVEAILLIELGDEVGINPERTAIGRRAAAGGGHGARRHIAPTRYPIRRAMATGRGELHHQLLHRPAGGGLHNGEINQQNAEQRRDHQQHAAEEIGGHARPPVEVRGWEREARGQRSEVREGGDDSRASNSPLEGESKSLFAILVGGKIRGWISPHRRAEGARRLPLKGGVRGSGIVALASGL